MFPPGFRLALDPGTRRIDNNLVLVGGAPLRLLRLTPAGADLVDRLAGGEPIPAGEAAQRLARRLLDIGMVHPRPPVQPARHTAAEVTVVIPVRDGQAGLDATLPTIGAAGAVVVVDDGSASPIRDATFRHGTPRGPAGARNTGWKAATTPFVAFVDADCELPAGWLEGLLPHFTDPDVVAVAPRVMTRGAPDSRAGAPDSRAGAGRVARAPRAPDRRLAYEERRSPLDRGPAESAVHPRGRVPFVPSAVLVVRRAALEEVGGFDETLRFGEDVDLIWRLAGRDHTTVRYEPTVRATHPIRGSFPTWLRQRFDYGTSAAPLASRHGNAVAPLVVSSWSAASWILAGLGWPVQGTALAAGTGALLAPRLRSLRHPWREALKLAGRGHLYAGAQIADAVRRAWWPVAVVAALLSRRARRAVVLAVAIPLAREWMTNRPDVDPWTWAALRLADDVAYGAGVWAGCLTERSARALIPDLSNWPGRRPPVESLRPPP